MDANKSEINPWLEADEAHTKRIRRDVVHRLLPICWWLGITGDGYQFKLNPIISFESPTLASVQYIF